MKKIKMLLASALVFTSIFSVGIQNAHADTKTDADTTVVTEQAKEKTASVQLDGNPTTGYEWQYEIKDTNIVKLADKNYVSSDSTGELCGAGGTYTWSFEGVKEGQTEVTFKYLRPWETEVSESKTYVVKVDSDLNVTITEKTAENPAGTGKISLHGNASTGYTWQYSVKDTSIAELSEEDSVSDDPTGQLCGAGETHIWDVKGLKEGQTEVTFNYLRPWESEILESKTYIVNVDSDLNVTVKEKEEGESSTNTGTDGSTSSSSSSTDITDTDSSTTSGSAVVYVVEIKDGNINKYTKNISTDEFQKHFYEVSSYIDEMVKKQQEEMNKFFDLFRNWNF